MTDDENEKLKQERHEAQERWRLARSQAADAGVRAQMEALTALGADSLRSAIDDVDRRIAEHAADGRPALPDGWAWDEYGSATDGSISVAVTDDGVEFEDDDYQTMSAPTEVVLAVLAAVAK